MTKYGNGFLPPNAPQPTEREQKRFTPRTLPVDTLALSKQFNSIQFSDLGKLSWKPQPELPLGNSSSREQMLLHSKAGTALQVATQGMRPMLMSYLPM